jgi:transcriptional regulator with XRE-family HTH domain
MSRKLDTYLRAYRLKSGLSQKDIAFLVSLKSSSTISKIEKQYSSPSLPIFLTYCIVFNAQPEDLVPGLLHDIEHAVIIRAHVLEEQLKKHGVTPPILQRIEFLKSLSSSEDDAH